MNKQEELTSMKHLTLIYNELFKFQKEVFTELKDSPIFNDSMKWNINRKFINLCESFITDVDDDFKPDRNIISKMFLSNLFQHAFTLQQDILNLNTRGLNKEEFFTQLTSEYSKMMSILWPYYKTYLSKAEELEINKKFEKYPFEKCSNDGLKVYESIRNEKLSNEFIHFSQQIILDIDEYVERVDKYIENTNELEGQCELEIER